MDDYQTQICNAAGGKIPRPDVFSDVYAFVSRLIKGNRYDEKFNKIKNKISRNAISKQNKYAMLVRCSHLGLIKSLNSKTKLDGAILIYSLWNGYKEQNDMKAFLNEITALGINIVTLHASGHADKETVEYLSMHVKPTKVDLIHTETQSKNDYEE
jgi:ribonuclease J